MAILNNNKLSRFRFDRARSNIKIADTLYKSGDYGVVINRAYYSAFDAMRSINALDGFDSNKHSGVISYFNQTYVKTNIFPTSTSSIIREASMLREKSDYEDFYIANKEDAKQIIDKVNIFLKDVEKYLVAKKVIK